MNSLDLREIHEIVSRKKEFLPLSADRILLGSNDLSPKMKRAMAMQIELHAKALKKCPHFISLGGYIPSRIHYEQSSSERTALYKAQMIGKRKYMVELTGGLGIDFLTIARQCDRACYYDTDPLLSQASEYNFPLFFADLPTPPTIEIYNEESLAALPRHIAQGCDLVLADPARRSQTDPKRIHHVLETIPSPRKILDILSAEKFQGEFLFKLTPMADIQEIREFLPETEEIHWVVYKEELKEILVKGRALSTNDRPTNHPLQHVVVTLKENKTEERLVIDEEVIQKAPTFSPIASEIEEYIYIPNPALMKLGLWGYYAQYWSIKALGQGSHLFCSSKLDLSFMGRCYKTIEVIPYKKRLLKDLMKRHPEFSITTRNFGISAEDLHHRLNNRESDSKQLIATTDGHRQKILIVAESISSLSEKGTL